MKTGYARTLSLVSLVIQFMRHVPGDQTHHTLANMVAELFL